MKKRKSNLKIVLTMISSLLFLMLLGNSVGYPNALDDNIPNSYKVLDSNVNGTYDILIIGEGNYSSGDDMEDYLDSNGENRNYLPKMSYGSTNITIFPEYICNDTLLLEDKEWSFSTPLAVEMDNETNDYYNDLRLNISRVEYLTDFDDLIDVVGCNVSVPSQNPYPHTTFQNDLLMMPNPANISIMMPTYDLDLDAFEDGDLAHYCAWAEARAWNFSYIDGYPTDPDLGEQYWLEPYQNPLVNVSVEIAVEIINNQMGTDEELNYDDMWDLIEHHYRMTLEAISEPRLNGIPPFPNSRGDEIVIAENMTFEASIKYRDGNMNREFIFDKYREEIGDPFYDGVIDVNEILNPPSPNPAMYWGDIPQATQNHWEYCGSINQTDIDSDAGMEISEEMFRDYADWKGYKSNYGNPVIVFNFTASGKGFNHNWNGSEFGYWGNYPPLNDKTAPSIPNMNEHYYRAGGVDNSGASYPINLLGDTCWAKLKFQEFDSKHRFAWDSKQNTEYNHEQDIIIFTFNESSSPSQPSEQRTIIHNTSKGGYTRIIESWEDRIRLKGNFTYQNKSGIYPNFKKYYEEMLIEVETYYGNLYYGENETQTDLQLDSYLMGRNLNNWTYNTNHLESESFYIESNPNYIDLSLNVVSDEIDGYICSYRIDFNEVEWVLEKDYENGIGNHDILIDDSFQRDIGLYFHTFRGNGNYIMSLSINSSSKSLQRSFQYYTTDIPKWMAQCNIDWLIPNGNESSMIKLIYVLDDECPAIKSYSISETNVNVGTEINLTLIGEDNSEIKEGFVIIEDKDGKKSSITLSESGSTFTHLLKTNDYCGDIDLWFGVQDNGGNFNMTDKITITINCDYTGDGDGDGIGGDDLSWLYMVIITIGIVSSIIVVTLLAIKDKLGSRYDAILK